VCNRKCAMAQISSLPSLMCWVPEYIQKTPMVVRAVIALVERGFAAFAKIPYQDSWAQEELLQLLDELEVAERRIDLTGTNYVPANMLGRRAAEWRPTAPWPPQTAGPARFASHPGLPPDYPAPSPSARIT
jgi:hypothetical protein